MIHNGGHIIYSIDIHITTFKWAIVVTFVVLTNFHRVYWRLCRMKNLQMKNDTNSSYNFQRMKIFLRSSRFKTIFSWQRIDYCRLFVQQLHITLLVILSSCLFNHKRQLDVVRESGDGDSDNTYNTSKARTSYSPNNSVEQQLRYRQIIQKERANLREPFWLNFQLKQAD